MATADGSAGGGAVLAAFALGPTTRIKTGYNFTVYSSRFSALSIFFFKL